ncbi:MAG TPA: hypothetical protein VKI44_05440 [Acetobacteraceae bacterium]|nr:hypothetical protein [Acetobacteraceae bacterium]
MRKIGLAIVGLVTATASHAQPDQYLCIGEHSAGVRYSRQMKTWQPQIFAPGTRYILRRLKGEERENKYLDNHAFIGQIHHREMSEWGFFSFGEQEPRATCDASFQCTTDILSLHFSQHTGRFEVFQTSGFWSQPLFTDPPLPNPRDEEIRASMIAHPDDGFVEIGTCSAF